MGCKIFSSDLISDIKNLNDTNININLGWLKSLIPAYNPVDSGIWLPLIVSSSFGEYGSPLMKARTGSSSLYSPCNCNDEAIISQAIDDYNICDYCGDYSVEWNLTDNSGNASPRKYDATCCSGACDVQMHSDDYVPKIPVLNQSYITGIYDFKYKKEFPACSNPGLGKERFITINDGQRYNIKGADMCIDWIMKDTISEIPYEPMTSQHDSEYLHTASYKKSKIVSKTCGNFILTALKSDGPDTPNFYQSNFPVLSGLLRTNISGDQSLGILPTPSQFSNLPYGIDGETYKNIFIHQQKLASYWKWNYTSGILCWYRYHDINRGTPNPDKDTRPIPKIDLYIPPGDVFFVTNDGPEPLTNLADPLSNIMDNIQGCPSGLKVTQGGATKAIIPSGSEFLYVSANLYDRFYNTYYVINDKLHNPSQALTLSAILCTSPAYDKITVDLLKSSPIWNYTTNTYQQIDILNRDMQKDTEFNSISQMNYISDRKELINTLYHKYGGYLWIPPNSSKSITLSKDANDAFYVDMDFDVVISKSAFDWSNRPNICRSMTTCAEPNFPKKYSYNQSIGYSQSSISTVVNHDIKFNRTCISGEFDKENYAMYAAIYLNDSPITIKPISTGCYKLTDIYPRISSPATQTFCSDCDQNSSFYLIPNADIRECGGSITGFVDFCYSALAFRYNNSPPQYAGDPQNRKQRKIADGTNRFNRNYRSIFFNPHIDIVAFHTQGGAAVNSKPFDLENFVAFEKSKTNSSFSEITVQFTTDDVGIKIYNIFAEFLQTQANNRAKCKRFPVKDSCKCLPIIIDSTRPVSCADEEPTSFTNSNIFTPSLSTVLSPKLKKYGGYNQTYLDEILESGTVIAGGTLTALRSKINPENPYGCDVNASITLYNYTNTEWNINPIGFDTNHADLILGASEDADLTGIRYLTIIDSGEDGDILTYHYEPVTSTKRFTTKIIVNDSQTLYDGQKTILSTLPENLNIKLQNPFLEALLASQGKQGSKLFPTEGKLLTTAIFGGNPVNNRGDEVSAVNITLTQRQRTQLLLFSINQPNKMGDLIKGFFHPNKGLTNSITDKTPIKETIDGDGKYSKSLYYDASLHNNDSDSVDDFEKGFCLHGTLNTKAKEAIYSVNEFDLHKKLRLYLQIGGKWYQYNGKNIGGFFTNNQTFPGRPFIFEYLDNPKNTKAFPGILPTSVKKSTYFDFVYNQYDYKTLSNGTPQEAEFPLMSNQFSYILETPKRILIQGTRPYYMAPEIDPSIDTQLDSIENIGSFSNDTLKFGTMIKFNDGSHWMCINPDEPSNRSSYIWTDYNYLYHNYSNLHLDFRNLSKNGYLYNSSRLCNLSIKLYHPVLKQWQDNTILKKSIIAKFVTKDGRPVVNLDAQDVYMIPYTVFEMERNVRNRGYTIIDLLQSYNVPDVEDRYFGFVVGYKSSPIAEFDRRLLNNMIPSKWGDVINYDNTILDPYKGSLIDPDYYYPKPTYNNDFYKMIVNNHNRKKHYYRLYPSNMPGTSFTISHSGLVYFAVLQPYNIGDGQPYSINAQHYHNYLPFVDINLLNDPNPPSVSQLETDLPTFLTAKTPYSGQIRTEGLHHFTSPATGNGYLSYGDNNRFWINFTEEDFSLVRSAFVPNSTFYSPTLRIDDPPYWFNNNTFTESDIPLNDAFSCRRTFRPSGPNTYTSTTTKFDASSSFSAVNIDKDIPYYRYPIYCDTDDGTCTNDGCYAGTYNGISQIGWKNAIATYKVGVSQSKTVPATVPYIISYDAGVYNVIGNSKNITIERFELPYQNNIELNGDACSNTFVFPTNYTASTVNPIYQKQLNDLNSVTHSTDVINTDAMANEMLFRILHGESQIINRKMLMVDKVSLTKKDLIAYTEPEITAKDIYGEILYNYDTNASMSNMKVEGSLYVDGILTIGSTATIRLGSASLNLRILFQDGSVYITGTYNGYGESAQVGSKIYVQSWEDKEYIIQTWGRDAAVPDPPAGTDNSSISFVGQCDVMGRRQFYQNSWVCNPGGGIYGPPCDGVDTSLFIDFNLVDQISYAEQEEHPRIPGRGGQCCGYLLPTCCAFSVRVIQPVGLQTNCGEPTWGSISFEAPFTTGEYPPCAGDGSVCSDYSIGYCGKSNCEACAHTLEGHDLINVDYEFQQCRTTYNLRGHAYRQRHRLINYTDTIIQPRPAECYTYGNYTVDGCDGPGKDLGSTTWCESWPRIVSVAEMEEYVRTHSPTGPAEFQYRDEETCEYYTCCGLSIGEVEKCNSQPTSCTKCGCDPRCGVHGSPPCTWKTNSGGECDFCLQGSFFSEPSTFTSDCVVGAICAISAGGDRGVATYRRIYLKTETKTNAPYEAQCPARLADISYTSKSITVSINGSAKCFSANLTSSKCPVISVSSTMQKLNVQDSMSTSCEECSPRPASLFLPDQQQSFVIRQETRMCLLGVKYSNSVNNMGTHCLPHVCMQCGGGGIEYGCQQLGTEMVKWSEIFGAWQIECLKGLPGGMTNALAAYEIPEWAYELEQLRKTSWAYYGDGAASVPVTDIIEGIIPGSVSPPAIMTVDLPGNKIKRDGSSQSADVKAHVAYVGYTYARPATIHDILRNDDSLLCSKYGQPLTNDIVSSIQSDSPLSDVGWCDMAKPFPPEYRECLSDYIGRRFFYINNGIIDGASYVETNPFYKQNSDCYDGITCYYKHGIRICGDGDFCCYADLQVVNNKDFIPSCGTFGEFGTTEDYLNGP